MLRMLGHLRRGSPELEDGRGDYLHLSSSGDNQNLTGTAARSVDRCDRAVKRRLKLSGATVIALALALGVSVSVIYRRGSPVSRDVKNFFQPRGLTPAHWDVPVQDVDCIIDSFRDIPINLNSSLLADWEERIVYTGCPIFPVPDGGLITHVYWSGPWRSPSHSLTTDAWLATQRLRDGHRLIWWYEGEGPDDAFIEYYTGDSSRYKPFVEIRRFEDSIADGTCLETMQEWYDGDYQFKLDMPIQTRSDLIRLLLLFKFGGIWMDADSIPIRDFTPLIRGGPSIPEWAPGGRLIRYNNNVLIYGPVWSGVAARVLELACQMPYDREKFTAMYPKFAEETGFDAEWYWLYNDGVHRLCRGMGCGVSGLPVQWMDMRIWTGPGLELEPCEPPLPDSMELPSSLHGPFVYHGRLNKLSDEQTMDCFTSSRTLVRAIKNRVDQRLLWIQLSQGGDLFPGPGYVD